MQRNEILERLRSQLADGESIRIGKIKSPKPKNDSSDLDLLFLDHTISASNSPLLAGFLPIEDANSSVMTYAKTFLPMAKEVPVIAGVCGSDPFRLFDKFLHEIKMLGFVGVQNFPSLGFIDGTFRSHLEKSQMGYEKEVEMIRLASEMDLLTVALVFQPEEATQMADAGADILIAHPGARMFRKEFDADEFQPSAKKILAWANPKDRLLLRYVSDGELAGI